MLADAEKEVLTPIDEIMTTLPVLIKVTQDLNISLTIIAATSITLVVL